MIPAIVIERSFTAYVLAPSRWVEIKCSARFTSADPFAVSVTLDGVPGWVLSRELLREGLDHPAGFGDARFWPSQLSPNSLYMHLSVPGQQDALIELPRNVIAEIVAATDRLVPPGSEQSFDEDEIQRVLDKTWQMPTTTDGEEQ